MPHRLQEGTGNLAAPVRNPFRLQERGRIAQGDLIKLLKQVLACTSLELCKRQKLQQRTLEGAAGATPRLLPAVRPGWH